MAGMGPKIQQDGTWVYPHLGATLAMVGLEEIGVYTACHQNTVCTIQCDSSYHGILSGGGAESRNLPIHYRIAIYVDTMFVHD